MEHKRITHIVSNIDIYLAGEWVCEYMDKQKIDLSFIILGDGKIEFEDFLKTRKVPFKRINYRGKKDILKALVLTSAFLKSNRTEVIHCHLFDASLIGLFAGYCLRIPKRIYTRHHSTLHHEYHPGGVKYDRLMNFLCTDVVAISEVVKRVLIDVEKVSPAKVHTINHGFIASEFMSVPQERILHFKKKYGINNTDLVVGVVARHTFFKGIQYIIPAFSKLLQQYPNAKLLLANCIGDYEQHIKLLLQTIPTTSVIEIKFEKDIAALYKALTIYVHVPINEYIEAFGQTYVEALMAGTPSIFTLSGIANEFIINERNALVVDFKSEEQIYEAMCRILSDSTLRDKIVENGIKDTNEKFALNLMIEKLQNLYLN